MLTYKNIYAVNQARRRMLDNRRDRYAWRNDGVTRDQDRLTLFTLENSAVHDSLHNLTWLLEVCKKHHQRYLVLSPALIQSVGRESPPAVATNIAPREWIGHFRHWMTDEHQVLVNEPNDRGTMTHFQTWRRCFTTREHQGVYEVSTGRRLTRREEIIESFWDMGFATWRGRPYSMARLRWAGDRTELEELTDLYHRHWSRARVSDMSRKMCSAFTSINRYAAWPGAW